MKSLGSHKLPLIGEGDINDVMNKVGIKGKGESVCLGFFLYGIVDKFIKMMNKYDKGTDLTKYTEFKEKLKDNLNDKTWDDSYYLRAFFDNGDSLGSHENTECKIDLLPQCLSILSEVASKDRIDKILESIDKQLVEDNLIKQISPALSKSINNPGIIMDYPKGIKENGGQVNQTTSWYIMTLIKEGYYDKAYDYYKMTNPINRNIDDYKVEPYVTSDSIYSNEEFLSRGGYTWYTSSSGWLYRIGIEEILGIKKHGNKLVIKPNIPKSWNNYKAVYKYKDTIYNIEVVKGKKESILLDDEVTESVSLKNDKKTHKIIVNIK
jgi:cellobiose phosphorylase